MKWLRRLFAHVGWPMEPAKREFHYDSTMSSVVLGIAADRAQAQRFGMAMRKAGDPRSYCDKQKWADDCRRGYDMGESQHPFDIYREMFAEDKKRWKENHR